MSKLGACLEPRLRRGADSGPEGGGCCSASWGQQLLDGGVAFGDLLEGELVGCAQALVGALKLMFRAIIAGEGGNDLLVRGVAVMVAMGSQLPGVTLSVQDTAYSNT